MGKKREHDGGPVSGFKALKADPDDLDPRTEEPMQMEVDGTMEEDSRLEKNGELPTTGQGSRELRDQRKATVKAAEKSGLTELKPRGYQLELATPAIEGKNCVICAPTGSGKTLTAGLVCQKLSQRNGGKLKALFIVCQRSLVDQQKNELSKYLPRVASLGTDQFLDTTLDFYDVIVLTAQIVVNSLKNGELDLEKLTLVIFDECHHANLDHPYNEVMKYYYRKKLKGSTRLPQIIGMTASLGVGSASNISGARDHYVRICANLDCDLISHVTDPNNKAELERLNPKPDPNQIKTVDRRPANKEFYILMRELMEEIEEQYLSKKAGRVERGTQEYEGLVSELVKEAERTEEGSAEMVACEVLKKMNLAWMVHDELRAKDALALLDKYFTENLVRKPGEVERTLCQWYAETRKDLKRIANEERLKDWPLLEKLCEVVEERFEEDIESIGIIMASTIQCVDGLLGLLKDQLSDYSVITPDKFVGHRRQVENSQTEAEQKEVLNKFRAGKVNLLVCTDVAQEGIDIPKCKFVIRYNFVSNEIGAVQSQGRARAKDSRCYLISYDGSVNVDREMRNLCKERLMQAALDEIVSTTGGELLELVNKYRETICEKLRAEETPMETRMTENGGSSGYAVHCRRCKAFLSSADHLVKYGCHYICIDDGFVTRITVETDPSPKEFREDTLCGKSLCHQCRQKIGAVLRYKRGARTDGYTLGKESVMWKKQDAQEHYGAIKKWENVPFHIREVTRN